MFQRRISFAALPVQKAQRHLIINGNSCGELIIKFALVIVVFSDSKQPLDSYSQTKKCRKHVKLPLSGAICREMFRYKNFGIQWLRNTKAMLRPWKYLNISTENLERCSVVPWSKRQPWGNMLKSKPKILFHSSKEFSHNTVVPAQTGKSSCPTFAVFKWIALLFVAIHLSTYLNVPVEIVHFRAANSV